jgi:hypothetical protein
MKSGRSRKELVLDQELRAMLNEWNPIGCPLPPDEYDCMIQPLLGKLRRGCNEAFIVRFLQEWLRDHIGLTSRRGMKEFAAKVCAWYASRAIAR